MLLFSDCPSDKLSSLAHYANIPTQKTAILHGCKNGNFSLKKNVIFFLFLLKTLIVGTR